LGAGAAGSGATVGGSTVRCSILTGAGNGGGTSSERSQAIASANPAITAAAVATFPQRIRVVLMTA
jgi:hypothetical protein